MLKKILVTIFIVVTFSAFSVNNNFLENAFEKINEDKFKFYYKTELIMDGLDDYNGSYIFDPEDKDIYQLVDVDGDMPSERDQKKFMKFINDNEENSGVLTVEKLRGASFELVNKNGSIETYNFKTKLSFISDREAAFVGHLIYNRESDSISEIELVNDEFMPVNFAIKISDFNVLMKFEDFNDDITVLKQVKLNYSGKATFIGFSQESVNNFSDFKLMN